MTSMFPPVTIWRDTDGLGEYSNGGVYNIADPSGTQLADPSAVLIVDTGVIFTPVPDTVWQEDNSK